MGTAARNSSQSSNASPRRAAFEAVALSPQRQYQLGCRSLREAEAVRQLDRDQLDSKTHQLPAQRPQPSTGATSCCRFAAPHLRRQGLGLLPALPWASHDGPLPTTVEATTGWPMSHDFHVDNPSGGCRKRTRLWCKAAGPEIGCVRLTNPARRRAIAPRTLAMKSRIRNLNRQTPRDHLGWLCVANNGDCLCDRMPCRLPPPPLTNENRVRAAPTPPRAVRTHAEGARSASTATEKWDRCGDSDTRAPTPKGIHRTASDKSGALAGLRP
jgi:hypothetical protein